MLNTISWTVSHPRTRAIINCCRYDESGVGIRPRHPIIACSNFCSSVVFFWLATTTSEPGARVYVLTVALLFAVSALYHWKFSTLMCRIDQTAILALVINTAFPYVHNTAWALCVLMLTAAYGIVLKWYYCETREQSNRNFLFVGMVAFGLYCLSFSNAPAHNLALFSLGVVLHIAHLAVYDREWCDWFPALLGHREIQHALILTAVTVHTMTLPG